MRQLFATPVTATVASARAWMRGASQYQERHDGDAPDAELRDVRKARDDLAEHLVCQLFAPELQRAVEIERRNKLEKLRTRTERAIT